MGQINWLTSAGSLGTITENEYFEFQLDAYDTDANISEPIVFSIIAGTLAPGLELSSGGLLYGIPSIVLSPLVQQSFTQEFAIRAKVAHSGVSYLTDRTFSITLNPVALPQIYPSDVTLGYYQDGRFLDIPLLQYDKDPLIPITWELVSGEIPLGTQLTADGRLYGYILPTVVTPAGSLIGWDATSWDNNPWELLTSVATVKTYTFTVQVYDGSRIDKTTYSINVTSSASITVDSTIISIDNTYIRIDTEGLHTPYIITPPQYLPDQRQFTNFDFQVVGVDIDHAKINYQLIPPTNLQLSKSPPVHATFIGNISGSTLNVSSLTGDIVLGSHLNGTGIDPDTKIVGQSLGLAGKAGTYQISIPQNISTQLMTIPPQKGDQWWDTVNNQILIYSKVDIPIDPAQVTAGLTYTISSLGNAYETLYFNRGTLVTPDTIVGLTGSYTFSLGVDGSSPVTYTISTLHTDTLSNIASKMQSAVGSGVASIHPVYNSIIISSHTLGLNSAVDLIIPALSGNDLIGNINSTLSSTTTLTSVMPTDFTQIGAASNTINESFVATKRLDTLAGHFIVGQSYTITYVGNTNFIALGATTNSNGARFIALGTGTLGESGRALQDSGSGSATLTNTAWEVMIPSTVLQSVNLAESPIFGAPLGIDINPGTGWISGNLLVDSTGNTFPISVQEQTYIFQAQVWKTLYPIYESTPITFVLTVLGSEADTITWITPSVVGTLNEGTISDLAIQATSSMGYQLVYEIQSGALPSGLSMLSDGLIIGQVPFTPSQSSLPLSNIPMTFDISSTTPGPTTFDKQTTNFDSRYTFTVQVRDINSTIFNYKTFTIDISTFNILPYENLYLKALTTRDLRLEFLSIMNNTEIFPDNLIYRRDDPWFGKAIDIKFLFAAGLNVESAATYISHMQNNTYNKVINLGNVKTAVALDANFNVKYEVVYVEVTDSITANGKSPAAVINLPAPPAGMIPETPDVYYPNSFANMKSEVTAVGYVNQGAIPEWMLATQPNGTVLGFTYGVVLAYTVPGASNLIAYRLLQSGISFNNLDFVVDRYQLNTAIGLGSQPEIGDIYLKFPKVNSFGA